MLLVWHQRPHLERKLELAEAFGRGLTGAQYRIDFGLDVCGDVLVLFGIGGVSKAVWDAYRAAGKKIIFLDKGYTRGTGHWRVAVNDFQPLAYLSRNHRSDRFRKLEIELSPFHGGTHVLFDGASNKFCQWKQLGPWAQWGREITRLISEHTAHPIIYRPRPSDNATPQVVGAEVSEGPLDDDLARARVCVSYGGNIGWDALVAGVPHFAIGDSIARPLSETRWDRLDRPRIPSEAERLQWCADVAYQQWTTEEFASGEAWQYIKGVL